MTAMFMLMSVGPPYVPQLGESLTLEKCWKTTILMNKTRYAHVLLKQAASSASETRRIAKEKF